MLGPLELLVILLLVAIYSVPSIVAFSRRHHNAVAILLLNLFLGYTFLGWIAALIWSMTSTRPRHSGPPKVY